MIVEIKQVKPSFDVFALRSSKFNQSVSKKGDRFLIAVRTTFFVIRRPNIDLPRLVLVLLVLLDPSENFSVTLTFFEFFQQSWSRNTEKLQNKLGVGAIVVKLAVFTCDGSSPFIERSGKDDVEPFYLVWTLITLDQFTRSK